MTRRGLVKNLPLLVVASWMVAGGWAVQSALAAVDPVAETMSRMRVASTLLVDERRITGSYPFADGSLHPLREVFASSPGGPGPNQALDAWGHTLWYRANQEIHELISYGADSRADKDYAAEHKYSGRFQQIEDAADPRNDLVLKDGRFVRRPFGSHAHEFVTINAINAIFIASSSFAVDNNQYPGSATTFTSVAAIAGDLVPIYIRELPADGWGRPIMYTNIGGTFALASFGEDGIQNEVYNPDLPCELELSEEGIILPEGGDVVQVCGRFTRWPRGTEP